MAACHCISWRLQSTSKLGYPEPCPGAFGRSPGLSKGERDECPSIAGLVSRIQKSLDEVCTSAYGRSLWIENVSDGVAAAKRAAVDSWPIFPVRNLSNATRRRTKTQCYPNRSCSHLRSVRSHVIDPYGNRLNLPHCSLSSGTCILE